MKVTCFATCLWGFGLISQWNYSWRSQLLSAAAFMDKVGLAGASWPELSLIPLSDKPPWLRLFWMVKTSWD